MTEYTSLRRTRAIPWPMPLVPPVTSATRELLDSSCVVGHSARFAHSNRFVWKGSQNRPRTEDDLGMEDVTGQMRAV